MLLFLLFTLCFLFVFYAIVKYYRFVHQYPKGPFPLPFIGNFTQFNFTEPQLSFAKFAEEFRGVFTLHIMHMPCVVFNTYEALREAYVYNGEAFTGRPVHEMFDLLVYAPSSGVLLSNGDVWREQRRNALHILRDYGMGRYGMEEKVKASVEEFLAHIDSLLDKDRVDLRWPIQVMMANVINGVLFGLRYAYDDCAQLMDYVEEFRGLQKEVFGSKLYIIVANSPLLKKIPWLYQYAVGKYKPRADKFRRFMENEVNKALKGFDVDHDEPTCFVQSYAQNMKKNTNLDLTQLCATGHDFFTAGQETTTNTFRWAVLYLAANQDVQDKLRAEIFSVVGSNGMPSMADRPKLPYAVATVTELQRCANILPASLTRETLSDCVVQGHKIPKGTQAIVDIYGILARDPLLGENKDQLRPERFLTKDGTELRKEVTERVIPFTLGRRSCAGESLARMELFLAVTTLVQKYRILPCPDAPIDFTPLAETVIMPKRQPIKLEKI